MSYSRFGWNGSDVYVFMDFNGYLHCCGCILKNYKESEDGSTDFLGLPALEEVPPFVQNKFYSTAEMIAHLQEHIKSGHTVPDSVIPELLEDDRRNFGEEKATWLIRKKEI